MIYLLCVTLQTFINQRKYLLGISVEPRISVMVQNKWCRKVRENKKVLREFKINFFPASCKAYNFLFSTFVDNFCPKIQNFAFAIRFSRENWSLNMRFSNGSLRIVDFKLFTETRFFGKTHSHLSAYH